MNNSKNNSGIVERAKGLVLPKTAEELVRSYAEEMTPERAEEIRCYNEKLYAAYVKKHPEFENQFQTWKKHWEKVCTKSKSTVPPPPSFISGTKIKQHPMGLLIPGLDKKTNIR